MKADGLVDLDLPCYTSPSVQDDFWKKILESCEKNVESSDKDLEIVQILAPLTDNPNKDGETPMYLEA